MPLLKQFMREIHGVEWQLRTFEDKYGMLPRDFYEAMASEQLSEFDMGEGHYFDDFLEWHGLYKLWLKREQTCC